MPYYDNADGQKKATEKKQNSLTNRLFLWVEKCSFQPLRFSAPVSLPYKKRKQIMTCFLVNCCKKIYE